jgi:hypothetical protein
MLWLTGEALIESTIAAFERWATRLERGAEQCGKQIMDYDLQMEDLALLRTTKADAMTRATKTAKKLRALVSP